MNDTARNSQRSQDPNAVARKKKFVMIFAVLFVCNLVLAVVMIICGSIAASRPYSLDKYFVGGFVVGGMVLLGAVVCGYMVYQGYSANDEQLTQTTPAALCGFSVFVLTLLGCIISAVFLGFFGFLDCKGFGCIERKSLSIVLVIGTVLTFVTAIIGMCALCTCGNYLANSSTYRRHGVTTIAPKNARPITTYQLKQTVAELQRQNQLLQQQLSYHQQMHQRQQRQQLEFNYEQYQPEIYRYFRSPIYFPAGPGQT